MHICSVIIYPSARWRKKFIGTSSILARSKCRRNWNSSDFPSSRWARAPVCLSFGYNLQFCLLVLHLFPPHHRMFQWIRLFTLSKSSIHTGIWYFQFFHVCLDCLDLIFITFKPPAPRSCAYCVTVIQSEHLKHSISLRNQSAKYPDSGCFGISGVVIGSALSKGWMALWSKTWPKPETAHEKPLAPRVQHRQQATDLPPHRLATLQIKWKNCMLTAPQA